MSTSIPESFYFPPERTSVHHLAFPGDATFARLTRRAGQYWLAIVRGEFVRYDAEQKYGTDEADDAGMAPRVYPLRLPGR